MISYDAQAEGFLFWNWSMEDVYSALWLSLLFMHLGFVVVCDSYGKTLEDS